MVYFQWQQQREEQGYIHPGLAGSKACAPSSSLCYLLKRTKGSPLNISDRLFHSLIFFLSACLCQPDAGKPAVSHSGLLELTLPPLLSRGSRRTWCLQASALLEGEKKTTGVWISNHPLLAVGSCTLPLCTYFHAHKLGIIIFYFRGIRYKNIYNLNMIRF